MAETIRELLIKIGLDSQAAINGIKRIDNSFSSLKSSAMLVIGAIGTIAGSLFLIGKSAADVGVELHKTAEIIGMSTVELQRLRGAARLAEVDAGSLTAAMRFFGKTVGIAMNGGKEQMKSLRQVGITSLRDVNGHIKTQSQLLMEVADRMSHATTAQEKLFIATKMFGRHGGAEMIPFLSGGKQKIKEMMEVFDKFGYTLSENDIKNSRKFELTLNALKMAMEGLKNKIGYALLPKLNEYGMAILNLIQQNKALSESSSKAIDLTKYSDFAVLLDIIRQSLILINHEIDNLKEKFKNLIPIDKIKKSIKDELLSMLIPINFQTVTPEISIRDFDEQIRRTNKQYYPNPNQAIMGATAKALTSRDIKINNSPTINITVPSGTSESQQAWFKRAAADYANDALQNEIRNVIVAHPLYEGT